MTSLSERLSPRQREVLRLAARGLTNAEIGGVLGISGETVRTHLSAILYRLQVTNRTEAAAAYLSWDARTERVAEVLERPAIAVLPVLPLDRGPRARTIVAGLTCDLVGLFSRWCWFPVIAHASTSDARSLGDTAQEIGRRLGARFLVDGALRSSPAAWHLSAGVIDATSGYSIWNERYDFARDELFEVQEEVCQEIVAAAYTRMIEVAQAGVARGCPPTALDAWALAHHALLQYRTREQAANARARASFSLALEREPTLMLAHFGLGLASYDEVLNQWGPARPATDRLHACAERCLELGPHMAEGYYLAGRHFQTRGEQERAVSPLREAIGRNPSFAAAHALLAQVLLLTGRLDEGIARMKHACRLGPRSFGAGLAVAHFIREEYADARVAAEHAIAAAPHYPFARALSAVCAWRVGDAAGAVEHFHALANLQSAFDPSRFLRTFGASVDGVVSFTHTLEAIARTA